MTQMSQSRRQRKVSGELEAEQQARKMALHENKICAEVGQTLVKHYPGWSWSVVCVWPRGVVTAKCLNLHGDYGIVIPLQDLMHDESAAPNLKIVIRGAGELLERCGMGRGEMRPEEVMALRRDLKGNIADIDTHGAEGK